MKNVTASKKSSNMVNYQLAANKILEQENELRKLKLMIDSTNKVFAKSNKQYSVMFRLFDLIFSK